MDSFIYSPGHCRGWCLCMQGKTVAESLFVHCNIVYINSVTIEKWLVSLRNCVAMRKGGYSDRKPMGVCRWPLKIGPKKIEGKMEFGPKRSNSVRIGSFSTPKRSFWCQWMRKSTPKRSSSIPRMSKKGVKTAAHPYHPI